MTDFIDQFPDAELLAVLGDSVTYLKSGAEYAIKAEVNLSKEQAGDEFFIAESVTRISILKSSLPFNPQLQDKITHKGIKYKLDGLLNDDGSYETWAMVKV